MSELANTLQNFISTDIVDADGICRDERCERLDVHVGGPGACIRRRSREALFRTRSRRHAAQPWRAYHAEALHESVLAAVSSVEPRNFSLIFSLVENDYGSCCDRTVHRHLGALREEGKIVRMDFKGRIHAYLLAGSRMLADPTLVLEQIIDLHSAHWEDHSHDREIASSATAQNISYRSNCVMPTNDDLIEVGLAS